MALLLLLLLLLFLFELMSAMIHVKKSNGRCNLTGGLGLPGMGEANYHPSLAGLWPPSPLLKLQQKKP